ncbi:MAG: DUF362 domain-containing protein [Bacteroidetes bacterium]|nr:DUF362 domain-containing protein [Bacteroidota bacterium]
MDKISRREFVIKGTTVTLGAGIMLKSGLSFNYSPLNKSKVVEVFHPEAVAENRVVDQAIVQDMLGQGLESLTGKKGNPLATLIDPNDTVGLKINCLGRPMLYTHHELINAMITELKEIGVKENNIIVWDRYGFHMTDCGFTMNDTATGIRYFATQTHNDEMSHFDPEYIYKSEFDNPERRDKNGIICRFSNIFTKQCDKIINMAILKDHGLAGVTLCLKNISYGICNNNGRFHGPDHISTFITDIYSLPEVREKIVLNIIDGLEACFENGPVPRTSNVLFTPKTLWLGTDPVALDTLGLEVIETKREKKGYPALKEIRPTIDHIEMAAGAGLGKHKKEEIEVVKIDMTA